MPKPLNTQPSPAAPPVALLNFFKAIRKMALSLDAMEATEKDVRPE